VAAAKPSAVVKGYNETFESLVAAPDDIEGFIAYGLYKQAKREWVLKFKSEFGYAPKPSDERAFASSWTETSLQALKEAAESALSAYAQSVVHDETPSIERNALMIGRPLWKDVVIGVASAFAYSVILVVAAFLLSVFGNDFIDATKTFGEKSPIERPQDVSPKSVLDPAMKPATQPSPTRE
jgi:hypothetical protein